MTNLNDLADLCERLREGVISMGVGEGPDDIEMFDIADADEVMFEAAQTITEAATTITALQADVAALREAFLRSADKDMHPTNAGRISTYGDVAVACELFAMGLVKRPNTFSLATPLGLAVRRILEETK